jgi:fumarate hydratase class II
VKYRVETDTLGKVRVPADRYYGAQTQRAVTNFPVSGLRLQPGFVRAQAIIKRGAALANMASGRLDERIGAALVKAAGEVMAGKLSDHFVVDVFQAGAGTSQNMNINEVLANRACEILGGRLGDHRLVHPNDHANMSQSTNDTIHTAIHISAVSAINGELLPAARGLAAELKKKSKKFEKIVKSGRTHMQDAVPVTLGQEFGAYATMVELGCGRVEASGVALLELCIGGTAVGTGLNTDPQYKDRIVTHISEATGHEFKAAADTFEAMQGMDAVVEVAGALRVLVTSLRKISGDLILLGSGPRTGLGEIRLPAVQPGSSIMPGKVNPVMAEMLSMVCFHALGCDATVVAASQAGQLELNVMMPVIAYNLLQEIEILAGGLKAFAERCVKGLEADSEVCRLNAERSPALATALNPEIGYSAAAKLALEALAKNALIRDLALKKKILDVETLERILDLKRMTEPPQSNGWPKPVKRSKSGPRSANAAGSKKRSTKRRRAAR